MAWGDMHVWAPWFGPDIVELGRWAPFGGITLPPYVPSGKYQLCFPLGQGVGKRPSWVGPPGLSPRLLDLGTERQEWSLLLDGGSLFIPVVTSQQTSWVVLIAYGRDDQCSEMFPPLCLPGNILRLYFPGSLHLDLASGMWMEVMRAISDTAHYEHLIQGPQLVSSVVAFIHRLDGDDPKDSEQRGVTRWKEPGSLNDWRVCH